MHNLCKLLYESVCQMHQWIIKKGIKLETIFCTSFEIVIDQKGERKDGVIRDYQSRIWTWVVHTKTLLCTISEPFQNQSDCKSTDILHYFYLKIGIYFVPITMSFFTHIWHLAWSLKNETWLFSFSRTYKKIFRFLVHTIVCTHIIYITNTNKLILAPSAKITVFFFFFVLLEAS